MSKAIELFKEGEVESKNIEVGEWGLVFKGQLTPDEWYKATLAIQKFDGKIQWYLGDLAAYAESPVTGWGESKYAELMEGTGYDYQTLSKFAQTARRFSINFREQIMVDDHQCLSFSHFYTVKGLNDEYAYYWLGKAADNAWGVAKLREEIRKWKEQGSESDEEENEDTIPTLAQRIKESWTRIKDVAQDNEAELIRIQVIKNDKVIDEELVEL